MSSPDGKPGVAQGRSTHISPFTRTVPGALTSQRRLPADADSARHPIDEVQPAVRPIPPAPIRPPVLVIESVRRWHPQPEVEASPSPPSSERLLGSHREILRLPVGVLARNR